MSDLDPVRLVVGAAFLAVAARSDWRSREVRDRLWVVLGTIALVLFGVELAFEVRDPLVSLVLVPAAVLFYGVFYGEEFVTEEGWRFPPATAAAHLIALVAAAFPVYEFLRVGDATAMARLRTYATYLAAPVMIIVVRALYQAHLIKGGADAKALIAIAVLVPSYPVLPDPFPLIRLAPAVQDALSLFFPFAFLVLLNAAILFLAVPLALLAYNVSRGHAEFPVALVGYKVSLDTPPRFVWFMDQIADGEHIRVYFPTKRQDRPAILRDLRAAGFREAWVTPQLPFMIPIAVGFVLAFLLGHPLMGLLQFLTPGR